MDRAEAIKELTQWRDQMKSHGVPNYGKKLTALDLAIEALVLRDKYVKALERMIEGAIEINKFLEESAKKSDEKLQLSGETSTNEGETSTISEKESVDCISRADTIKAMCQECKVFPDDEVNCADCTEVAIVRGMPPVKLKDPDDSLLTDDSEACKEQKSKLDCISRADAIAYIDRIINTGLGKNKSLDYIRKYISALPSAETHEIRTETHGVCSDCISRQQAIDEVKKMEMDKISIVGFWELIESLPPVTPTVKVRQVDTLIIAAALRDFAQDSERNISDRERAEELREQVLECGASMCNPVTPTERTGEWVHDGSDWENRWVCDKCGHKIFEPRTNFCPNCGAKMGEIDNE